MHNGISAIRKSVEVDLLQNEKWLLHKKKVKKTLLDLYRRRGMPDPAKMRSSSFRWEHELLEQLVGTIFMTKRMCARWFRINRENQTRISCEMSSVY